MKLAAKTLYGLEDVAQQELAALGAHSFESGNRIVHFEGDQELLYRANLVSRTILRILVPISTFTAHNDRHLYQMTKKVPWSKYFTEDQTFVIDATVHGKRFRHSRYAAQKVKDAIVDQFREKTDQRPNIDTRDPEVRLNLHISETSVTLSMDSSGESLEKRGYRTESNEAPISECLAAAMLLLSKWDAKTTLIDAMTGSGTIAIEAALMASNTPPGLFRKFGFQRWNDFDSGLFSRIEHELRSAIEAPTAPIIARDLSERNIAIAKRNARRAAVLDHIKFEQSDFLTSSPVSESAVIMMNPSYGERLEEDNEMFEFYGEIGRRLKHHYPGHQAWIISGHLKALKRLGFKPDKRFELYNGPIECRLVGISIYAGKKVSD